MRSNVRRWASPLFLLLWLCMLLAGCAREQIERQESFVFGTRVEVLVHGSDRAQARAATAEVLREFDRLHHKLRANPLVPLCQAKPLLYRRGLQSRRAGLPGCREHHRAVSKPDRRMGKYG